MLGLTHLQQVQYVSVQSPGYLTPCNYAQPQTQGYFQQPFGPYGQPSSSAPYPCSPYGYQTGMLSPPVAQAQMLPQYQYVQPQVVSSPPPSYAYAIAEAPEKKSKWYKL